jgi:hypothetical protein
MLGFVQSRFAQQAAIDIQNPLEFCAYEEEEEEEEEEKAG